ncbi:protein translocase SEC61 complex subunit gamma [Candidatus Nitrosopelagicus sp.]|nr:protein translocase SEC61 complex subunit gamma [Candidatus Nitrosopelagicus sp.]
MNFKPKVTFKNMVNTIKLTKKSDKDVYKQHLRLVLFGIGAIGGLAFIVQFTFSVFTIGR